MENPLFLASTDLDEFEVELLKSSLLFGQEQSAGTRQTAFQKAILAIVLVKKNVDIDGIKDYIKQQLHFEINTDALISVLNKLDKHYVVKNGESYSLAPSLSKRLADCLENLNATTEKLFNHVVFITEQGYGKSLSVSEKENIIRNIKESLSIYYEIQCLSFFDNGDSETTDEKNRFENIDKVVETAKHDLDTRLGKSLVYALGTILSSPNMDDQHTLVCWAKAHLASKIVGLDPVLSQFQLTKIREKTFILDTDVVLNYITDYAKNSNHYQLLVNDLISKGCKVYIPDDVIVEVVKHAESSFKCFGYFQNSFNKIDDKILESKVKNVFVESYLRKFFSGKTHCTFSTYMQSFYEKECPRDFVESVIREIFPNKVIYGMPDLSHEKQQYINFEIKEKLLSLILEKTKETEKANFRDPDENLAIAKADTEIFVSLYQIDEEYKTGIALNRKYYWLTTSTRATRCARSIGLSKYDITCNPNTLFGYLYEAGFFDNKYSLYVNNIFDNPFLFVTAEESWPEIKKIIDLGVDLKDKNVIRLRYDLNKSIDKLLTCTEVEEKVQIYKDILSRGYQLDSTLKELIELNSSIDNEKEYYKSQLLKQRSKDPIRIKNKK